ncbi:MAG: ATP-binding protein [Actinomycetota bacterium]
MPPSAPVYPVFAAVAVGMTGRTVYQVIDAVGGIFEAAGAVFEGSPDAPGTLIALLPPSGDAAVRAVRLSLQAQAIERALRVGVDAVEVHAKKEQDARWQQVIDSAVQLQKAARTGEAIAGDAITPLTQGAAATSALHVGEDTYLLLTGVHELTAVPDQAPAVAAEPPAVESALKEPPAIGSPDVAPPIGPTTNGAPDAERPAPVSTPAEEPSVAVVTPTRAAEPPVAVVAPTPVPEPTRAVEPAVTQPAAAFGATDASALAPEPPPASPARGDAGPVSAPAELYPKKPEPEPAVEEPATAQQRSAVGITQGPPIHPTARWGGPLVGRETQLADLRSRFDRVVADRSGAAVLITGEPGSGRTRLVAEFAASIDAANVLHLSCAPADGGGARWPLAALVEALAGLDPLAPAEPARARLTSLVAGQADADDLVAHLSAMLALEGASDPDHIRWALRRLLEAAAGGAPIVLHIDDADRAGSGFVRLLADVATAARGTPVLVAITTTRETENLPAIRLPALDREAIETLVGHLLGAAEDGVITALGARMSGLPFAIEQSLAMLTETGTLAPGSGRWMPLADLSRVPWPDTTVGAIRQRLQTLPPHELAVLGMAAVAGEHVATAPLLEVVPPDARPGMPAYLQDLVARGYLVADADDGFRFRHPLLREATMSGVPDWAQAVTHERFGRHLEATAGPRVWRWADAIGTHLEASCRLRPDAPPADRDDALTFLTWAATAATDQGDLDGAARLERRAAALTDDDPVRRAELLYLAAEHMATAAPDRPADREIAEAALAASVAGDDVDWRVRLLRAKLRTIAGHDDALEGARSTADEAIAAFGEDELGWALANAWALRGLVHAARAQHGLVADDLQRAADNASAAGRASDETAALRGAAAASLDGPVSVAEAEMRCRSFLDRVAGPIAEHDIRGILAVLSARRGAFDEARAAIGVSIGALEELGAGVDTVIALQRGAQVEALAGQPAAAEPLMQRALAAATHARDDRLRASLAASYAHVVLEDDRLDEALALADVAEAHAGDLTTQVGWRTARARVMVRRGRGALAERLIREGVGIAEQTDSTDLRASALVWAADVRRQAGRPAEAEPFERRALRLFERRGATAQAAAVANRLKPAAKPAAPSEQSTAAPVQHDALPSEPPAAAADGAPEPPLPAPEGDGATRLADEMMAMFSEQPAQRVTDEPTASPASGWSPTADRTVDVAQPPSDPEPTADEHLNSGERPSADIDPADELLHDPTATAEEESKRRWFSR